VIAVETAPTSEAIAAQAAARIAELLADAIAARGVAHLAVSGGNTPEPMFEALAVQPVAWDAVHLWQVDERVAPRGSAERNLASIEGALLSRISLPDDHLHPMPVEADDLRAAAQAYGAELAAFCGGVVDVVHLGLGEDGHTASWPPGDPVVDDENRDVDMVGPFRGVMRMTLTPRLVNRARHIIFLVTGVDKADIAARLLAGEPVLPACRVRLDNTELFAGGGAEAKVASAAP
jgi:6-phosphogluconolactonase